MPRNREYHLQLPHFHVDKSKNLSLLYGIRVTRDLVSKLSVFFLPIFLYQQGSSDSFWNFLPGSALQRGALLLVIFYLIHRLTVFLTAINIGRLITKIGYQKSLTIAFGLFGLFLSLLYMKAHPGWLILAAAFINGLETNFFWSTYLTLISKFTLQRHMGQDLGLLHFFLQLAQAIAPALGGLLVVSFGFPALFMVGLIGIMICLLFVLGMELKAERDRVSWKEFKKWLQGKTFLRLAVSQAGRYFTDAVLIFWPLYVFLILGAVDRVGFLYTLSLFLAMMISFGVGFYIDHQKSKKPFYLSGGLLSLLWILRSQVVSFWHIAIIDTIDRLTANFYAIFFDSILFKRGKGSQALSYFVYREIMISGAAILFWLAVGILFLVAANPWVALFSIAAAGALMGLLIQEHHKE